MANCLQSRGIVVGTIFNYRIYLHTALLEVVPAIETMSKALQVAIIYLKKKNAPTKKAKQ